MKIRRWLRAAWRSRPRSFSPYPWSWIRCSTFTPLRTRNKRPVAGPPGHVLPGPPSGSGNALISKYLADLGYNQDMIVLATIADPQHRLCLNPGLAQKKFHIDFWYNTEDGQHYTLPGNHGLLPPAPPAPLLSQGDGAAPLPYCHLEPFGNTKRSRSHCGTGASDDQTNKLDTANSGHLELSKQTRRRQNASLLSCWPRQLVGPSQSHRWGDHAAYGIHQSRRPG